MRWLRHVGLIGLLGLVGVFSLASAGLWQAAGSALSSQEAAGAASPLLRVAAAPLGPLRQNAGQSTRAWRVPAEAIKPTQSFLWRVSARAVADKSIELQLYRVRRHQVLRPLHPRVEMAVPIGKPVTV